MTNLNVLRNLSTLVLLLKIGKKAIIIQGTIQSRKSIIIQGIIQSRKSIIIQGTIQSRKSIKLSKKEMININFCSTLITLL